ncbi:isoleucine--tRNA ligase [Striga asiatica]|uniref:Isoleucine--tRNA ligase n=1 Tax=Striga asiatica TaxID=4170 RepID=A0A5A7NYW1_STRAF|nr:isoleucine--tRNA ligase [Striga asiatica]
MRRCSRPLVCCTRRSDSPGRRTCSCEPLEGHAGSRRWSLSPDLMAVGTRGRRASRKFWSFGRWGLVSGHGRRFTTEVPLGLLGTSSCCREDSVIGRTGSQPRLVVSVREDRR